MSKTEQRSFGDARVARARQDELMKEMSANAARSLLAAGRLADAARITKAQATYDDVMEAAAKLDRLRGAGE